MRRGITYLIYLAIVLILLVLPSLVRWTRFNAVNGPDPAEPPVYQPAGLAEFAPTPAASAFVDEPSSGDGLILLDKAHENLFDIQEIGYLDGRLSARGFELVQYDEGVLANALRPVSAFIIIAPMTPFTAEEIQAVTEFVERGGRLFLAGDPTRFNLEFEEDFDDITPFSYRVESDQLPLNSLANEFDLNFNGDYVYNTIESEGNYRNIIIDGDGFESDSITKYLEKVAFYGSHSIQTDNEAVALLSADDNTYSSATDRPGGLSLAALAQDGQVLAVGDIDFLSEPYFNVFDNSRFIAQIADFLAHDDRSRVLADFPYFFGDLIDLVYTGDPELGPDAFDEIIAWQSAFRETDRTLSLADEPAVINDTLYVGLYNQSEDVAGLLENEDIFLIIDPPIEPDEPDDEAEEDPEDVSETSEEDGDQEAEIEEEEEEEPVRRIISSELGDIQMAGTALILLTEESGQPSLVLLAASADGLESATDRLIDLMPASAELILADCLLQGNMALCPTNVEGEEVELELLTGGAPEPSEEDDEQTDEEDAGLEDEEEADESVADPEEAEEDSIIPDADLQGSIQLDETIEATLETETAHAWTFSDGPSVVNIVLVPEAPIDGILELFGPDGELMSSVDSDFTAGEERLDFIEIPDDLEYTIVVRDFFEEGGDYSLSVTSITPGDLEAIDQGMLTDGELVENALEALEVHSWTFVIEDATIGNITLTPGPDLDVMLGLFDPDDRLVVIADEGFSGEQELIAEVSLDELGVYTVVVTGYSFEGGAYSLLLELNQ